MNMATTATGCRKRGSSACESQIRLVAGITVDGQVRALLPQHRSDLRRTLSSHVRPLPNITDSPVNRIGRALRIHGFIDTTDAIARRVERVVDARPPIAPWPVATARTSSQAAGRAAARFLVAPQPLGGTQVHATEHELAGAERQERPRSRRRGRGRGARATTRPTRGRTTEHERHADCAPIARRAIVSSRRTSDA